MRPRHPWAVGLFLLGVVVFADASGAAARSLTIDDVLRLHSAGVSEDIILSEIIVTETVFLLDVDEILRLHEAGVSERVVQFMIDTARGVEEDLVDETTDAVEDEEVDVEVAVATTDRFVSLHFGYPVWWYDVYWWDYWDYDCHYSPWSVSWTHSCRAWYPTWYYPTSCWVSPGWGYRRSWWGPSYYDRWDNVPTYRTHSPLHVASSWKYKSGGGSAAGSLLASGLKTREGGRLDVVKPVRRTALAQGDTRRIGQGVRKPALPTREVKNPDARRPSRPVRKPAAVDHPVRKTVRSTVRAPGADSRKPPKAPDRPVHVQNPSPPPRDHPNRDRVQSAPAPTKPTKPTKPNAVDRGGSRPAPDAKSSPGAHSSGGRGQQSNPPHGGKKR